MTAALPMGGQKITGMADPTASTDGATKNYVDTTTASFFGTGDVKLTLKAAADPGWLLFDDGTFGSASSGSSNSNSANNLALFTLMFNNIGDLFAPILTSGGGATTRAAQTNASTAWAANCRMSLPKTLGRALAVGGSGAGLTARFLGQNLGFEATVLVTANLPAYTPAGTNGSGSVSVTSTNNLVKGTVSGPNTAATGGGTGVPTGAGFSSGIETSTGTATGIGFTGTAQGGTSTPFNNMQPTVFLNAMVKQ